MSDVVLNVDGSSGNPELEQHMAEIFAEYSASGKISKPTTE